MSQERVMLLIDADNLSVDVMEQAVRLLLNQHGGVHVRRAYCTAESAVANQAAFKRLGIKPMVNLAAGKNSTDIAMAVDAVDLVLSERPDVVVIASSDSDFAPLVQRLREKGCVVRGVGQKGKVGDETQDVYDDYTVLEHRGGAAPRTASAKTARSSRAAPASRARVPKAVSAAAVQAASARAPDESTKAAAPRKSTSRRGGRAATAMEPGLQAAEVMAPLPQVPAAVVLAVLADDAVLSPAAAPARTRKARTPKLAVPADGAAQPSAVTALASEAVAASVADAGEAAATPARRRGRKAATPAKPAAVPAEPPVADSASRTEAPTRESDTSAGASPRATQQAVLACLPELERGQSLALNVAVQRLREARLLGKNSSSLKLFSQLAESFELLPARNPSQVRLRR